LYITYENIYRTGILQAQVITPLKIMSNKYGIEFIITSNVKHWENDDIYNQNKKYFEKENYPKLKIFEFKKSLTKKQSIINFVIDVIPIIIFCMFKAKHFDIIHCRSYGGAIIGFIISIFTGKPFIFDMRGALPEETVELGKISKNSYKYKLLKFMEKVLINKSSYVFTVSNKFNDYIKMTFNKKNTINIYNPTDFKMFYNNKKENRKKVYFIYSGSLHPWHLPELTIKYFFKIFKKFEDKVFLYFCTPDVIMAKKIFDKYDIPNSAYEIKNVPFKEMPKYYAISDIAFCFIRNSFSKSVCFPVKFSEYIASEIFVLANKGIGDLADIINKYKCGLIVNDVYEVDSNIKKIDSVINAMLNGTFKSYNRCNLSFLDWNKNIERIYYVYQNIIGKSGWPQKLDRVQRWMI